MSEKEINVDIERQKNTAKTVLNTLNLSGCPMCRKKGYITIKIPENQHDDVVITCVKCQFMKQGSTILEAAKDWMNAKP